MDFKSLRKNHNLTLRQVEEKTGISNAYLSQLENGKIKRPSHHMIVTLQDFYAGHITTDVLHCPNCFSVKLTDVSKYQHNGIFGPGSSSRKVFDAMICDNCGVYFNPNHVKNHRPK